MGTIYIFVYRKLGLYVLLALALAFVLLLHGALPFFMLPTLGQAIWSTGFSQSFVNEFLSIYATNFGIPLPAAVPFGLSGVIVTAGFIFSGIHPADAYSAMYGSWLLFAFYGAYKISFMFGAQRVLAIICAILWMSFPITWGHQAYSMLALGIMLLPLYFYFALKVLGAKYQSGFSLKLALKFIFICILAIFMDGYTFLMFSVGVSIIFIYMLAFNKTERSDILKFSLPVYVFGFALAIFLYKNYVSAMPTDTSHSLDLFRGMGLDLEFLILPTKGMLWIFDLLDLNVIRNDRIYFGDASVWTTTFSAPILLLGAIGYRSVRHRNKLAPALLIVAVVATYMALGPSLKISSKKSADLKNINSLYERTLMPEKFALAPTGSAFISKNIPGFRSMRASYRWVALSIFGFWTLTVIYLAFRNQNSKGLEVKSIIVVAGLILLNLPNPINSIERHVLNRKLFFSMENSLTSELRPYLNKGEKIAFVPYKNDWLANYLSSILELKSYNIGGDKNLEFAERHWPIAMKSLPDRNFNNSSVDFIIMLLARGDADSVILPYIDLFREASWWPPTDSDLKRGKKIRSDIVADLKALVYLQVIEGEYFAIVKSKNDFLSINNLQNAYQDVVRRANGVQITVLNWGPKLTRSGVIPNIQTDGNGGIWISVEIEGDMGAVEVYFDGIPARKTYISGKNITAAIAPEYFKIPGKKTILIKQLITGRKFTVGAFLVERE